MGQEHDVAEAKEQFIDSGGYGAVGAKPGQMVVQSLADAPSVTVTGSVDGVDAPCCQNRNVPT